MHTLRYTRT